MLFNWRYRHRIGLMGCGPRFTPLDDGLVLTRATAAVPSHPTTMTIEVGDRYRIMILSGFDVDAAALLIKGLAVCG
ncbi:MAG: hypothetical protein WCC57_07705 [Paracoccaceae bacterium]